MEAWTGSLSLPALLNDTVEVNNCAAVLQHNRLSSKQPPLNGFVSQISFWKLTPRDIFLAYLRWLCGIEQPL